MIDNQAGVSTDPKLTRLLLRSLTGASDNLVLLGSMVVPAESNPPIRLTGKENIVQ